MTISKYQMAQFDKIIGQARFFVTRELRKLNFSETKITRFVAAARKPEDNKWRTTLPPLFQDKEGKWQGSRERSEIVAARAISEDIHAWQQAWENQQWGLAVKHAYVIGRTVTLLQMADFSTVEKRKGSVVKAANSSSRNQVINMAADLIEQNRLAAKKPKYSRKELHTQIIAAGHKIPLKHFYRIRRGWQLKNNSPTLAPGN